MGRPYAAASAAAIREAARDLAEDYGVLGRPLVYVTGKGGVGKTTIAGALALAVAARGRCGARLRRRAAPARRAVAAHRAEPALGSGSPGTSARRPPRCCGARTPSPISSPPLRARPSSSRSARPSMSLERRVRLRDRRRARHRARARDARRAADVRRARPGRAGGARGGRARRDGWRTRSFTAYVGVAAPGADGGRGVARAGTEAAVDGRARARPDRRQRRPSGSLQRRRRATASGRCDPRPRARCPRGGARRAPAGAPRGRSGPAAPRAHGRARGGGPVRVSGHRSA